MNIFAKLVCRASVIVGVALTLTLATTTPSGAQTPAARFVDSARVEIDAAVQASDTLRLTRAIVFLDRALTAFPKDAYLLHYRGYATYRRIIDQFRSNNMAGAAPLIASAIADLEQSSDKLQWAETYSLLSAVMAFRIGVDPSLGRTLGMEIGALSAKASQLGPNNPRVLLMQAIGAERTPPEYGGGVDRARTLLDGALKAFESDKPAPLAPAWGRAEALAFQKKFARGFF